MWRSSKVVWIFWSLVEVVIALKKSSHTFKFCTFIRHYPISLFQEYTQLWLYCLHFENGFRQVRDYKPHTHTNVMNMHAWPRVSEILPAALSTGKSLGVWHLGGLAALFSCSVLSDPDCFLFRNRPRERWTDTMLYIDTHLLKHRFFCGQFGANN